MSNTSAPSVGEGAALGAPKALVLGLQHMFAMFGATVTVPLLTGLDVGTTLLCAGAGTLLFHLITGGRVPAFLGSSFAFLAGYWAVTGLAGTKGLEEMTAAQLLPYACFGVACAGLLYLVLAGLIRAFGIKRVMRCFPPIVTGPIIIAIGLCLAHVAVDNCSSPIMHKSIQAGWSADDKAPSLPPDCAGVLAVESFRDYANAALSFSDEEKNSVTDQVFVAPLKEAGALPECPTAKDGTIMVDLAKGTNLFAVFLKPIDPSETERKPLDLSMVNSTVTWTAPSSPWIFALTALLVVVVCNIWGRGMIRILPILIGLIAAYAVACAFGVVDFAGVAKADWIGFPIQRESTILGVSFAKKGLLLSAVIAIVPIALATIMEHIGDICAISSTVGKDFLKDPGLHRTLTGDGLATTFASVLGGPANTTYGENTGVLALSRVFDPIVIRIAAVFAILLSFCPKFAAVIASIPGPIVGGVSFVLYGMISAVGIRNLVENKIDFSKGRNLIIAAVILVTALGGVTLPICIGKFQAALTPLALASLLGIVLNAIFPAGDYAARAKDDEPPKGNTFEV